MGMKIMKLHFHLNKLIAFLLFFLVSANVMAETKWEVATVFLGMNEGQDFQNDIDKNIEEIARISPSPFLTITTFRDQPSKLKAFLKKSFKDPKSKKMLVLYGHGLGPLGMRDLPTSEIKNLLLQSKVNLDLLWFDSCFLANLEFLYELRNTARFTIASQEAEFSAGLPFESLNELSQYDSPLLAANMLAKRFIDSYSYIKNGEQRQAVATSSATISIINNGELDHFINLFKTISKYLKELSSAENSTLRNKLIKRFSMDRPELIDLGHLLIELRAVIKDPQVDAKLTTLIRLLNIDSVKQLRTNARIKIFAPESGANMIFGFNNWENGSKEEYLANPLFKEILPSLKFVPGIHNQMWPLKKVEGQSITLSPFAPGINSFDYYFVSADGNRLLTPETKSLIRGQDVIETTPKTKVQKQRFTKVPGTFVEYSAYTQRVGTKAEKYTGVNITIFNTAPSIDYFELEFNIKADWLKL
jgi:hypothetical protein